MKEMIYMKNFLVTMAAAAVTLAAMVGCSKDPESEANASAKRFFDAWMLVNYPDLTPTELGYYILEEDAGSGEIVGDEDSRQYLYGRYNSRDLATMAYSYTDDPQIAKQVGSYSQVDYYGPRVWYRGGNNLPVGLSDMMSTMRVGGRRKAAIPSWLMTTKRYSKSSDYIRHSSSASPAIYELFVDEVIDDIVEWEIDSLKRYMSAHYPGVDSTKFGFYYVRTREPDWESSYSSGDDVYFNYIGRRLDGQVFDCTIRDTARRYGVFSESRDYEPVYINWDDSDYTALTMGEDANSIIPGFAYALYQMKKGEKGVAIFYSGLGYGSTGSGNTIPSYSPLIFELECVGQTDETDPDAVETDDSSED